ncbi:MerR HTH family regulatory protein [Noviherbaspirillum humi]|uniref:MerR HTH family regulatory protein n=1 Tax=Noviherbaspirillum humi TaxID=1688639 RepID=A0A239J0Z3_9BURK|nr:MerR family transcriptional regulator [Noviherbaspirillum humi]SNS99479.1 MerR HTH family regulatory protein [Noviherbaspirillum humi]
MSSDLATEGASEPLYRIGVAARLSGVPVQTLRVWERRYRVVGPNMSPRGQRLYSSPEIKRLALIKQLVDLGNPIGNIARLSTEALTAMLAAERSHSSPVVDAEPLKEVKVALVGPALSARCLQPAGFGSLFRVVAHCARPEDVERKLSHADADLAMIELATLSAEPMDAIERVKQACGAEEVLVLYRFAPSKLIRQLRAAGHHVARMTSDADELEALCRAALKPRPFAQDDAAGDGEPPPARYTEAQLAAFAGAAAGRVYCECPRHLAELLMSLGSFERYSGECASRSPEDALFHLELQQSTGFARALLENALQRVAQHEGLPLPDDIPEARNAA